VAPHLLLNTSLSRVVVVVGVLVAALVDLELPQD
jgi:hypothetical protein